ncbi:MAG TPA: hypothetical protein H9786_02305 [Candidatus Brachybacterium merdavium]|uniref:Pyrrolo-quinoline quinone repeat domain-containing protein n=1 Tax=Candidatus Brachybacterium merdavium TaxID=2838513 RepID=A0A9D2LB38_9MICO|nr:hypothetical protein [Candidatus Brachybacterium merdavium]
MRKQESAPEISTAVGAAVVLLALAGICALLASHLLIGALRLAAGVLAGAGLGMLVLPIARRWLPRQRRRLLAAALALLVAAALTVPAAVDSRTPPLEDQAVAVLEPLDEHDHITSVPDPPDPAASPVLIRRADGSAQLLRAGRLDPLEPADGDVLALSADGSRLLRIGEDSTRVLALPEDSAPVPEAVLPGQVLALADDRAVARACEDETCRLSGYDLAAAAETEGPAAGTDADDEDAEGTDADDETAQGADAGGEATEGADAEEALPAVWTVGDAAETRGPDPAGTQLPAASATEQPPGLLEATQLTGLVPGVPLRFDPAQGWLQLDPATGFPLGEVLAGPEQHCRIAVTTPVRDGASLQETGPQTVSVCSEPDGSMTARAHRDGAMLWESAPSPAGQWQVRLESGRVLAVGTEAGADVPGEIVASSQQADWGAPGGTALQEADALVARLGIDGDRMVAANATGQLLAYDTADGTNLWTLPLPEPEGMHGVLEAGTVVALDRLDRTHPLQPRHGRRLRIVDAATGQITQQAVVTDEVTALKGLSGGRALVTTAEHTLLLGPVPAA